MSDGGTVEATTNQDGATVSLYFSFKGGASGCPSVVAVPTARLDTAGMAVRADREPTTVGAVSVAAFFDVSNYYALVGSVAVDPSAAQSGCARRASFRAGLSSGGLPLGIGRGTAFTAGGNVYAVGSDTPGGTVKIVTTDSGTGISTFDFNYQQGSCRYGGTIGRPLSYDAGPSLEWMSALRQASTLESKEYDAQSWTFAVASTSDSLNGGIASDGLAGCPRVALYFRATAGANPTAVATPTATPAPAAAAMPTAAPSPPPAAASAPASAGSISGSFPPSGVGLAVFSGGSSAQLVTASKCSPATAAFFASDGSGGFVTYVPAATIAAVNAGWEALFAGGLAPNTAILGRCS